jgi:TolB protein
MLAVVGADGNLSIFDANGQNPFPITTDSQSGVKLYQWPTWSTDGRMAFFGASADTKDPYLLRVFVVDQVRAGVAFKTAYSSTTEVFTYAYWSPGDCLSGNCRDLALLFTPPGRNELALRLIRDNKGTFTDKEVEEGAPYYFSFSPDGKQMIWYRNTRQFDIYDVAADKIVNTLDDAPGKFNAPMWSPKANDNRILIGVSADQGEATDLVIVDSQGQSRKVIGTALANPMSFAWSPNAQYIAVVSNFNKINVYDATSGKTLVNLPESNILAHFWSPTSDRIAYITVSPTQSSADDKIRSNGRLHYEQSDTTLKWHILDIKTGKSQVSASFVPTNDMGYLLTFFDQFARSHSLWSPDGRYLVYGATVSDTPRVMMIDTQKGLASDPIKVADGAIGIWSWQ